MPTTDQERAIERHFGERVRMLRTARGTSQAALAEALGVAGGPSMNHSNLAKLERGSRGVGLGEAVLLASVLGTDLPSLLGEDMGVLTALAEAERQATDAAAAHAAAQERLTAVRGRIVNAPPLSPEDERAAADQAELGRARGGA